ncbi:MAG: hypothetical protein WC343_13675 [Bacilli bacterium]|jgi:hypothetical protein
MEKRDPAPATGQDDTTRPPQDLVVITGTATVINVPQAAPTHVDARIRDRFVRYTSDPATGLWRTGGSGVRELISPFALTRIETGRGSNVEIEAIHPRTGNVWIFEGSLDVIATALCRVGRAHGCRAERKLVYWALFEFCNQARRQAAARGVTQ